MPLRFLPSAYPLHYPKEGVPGATDIKCALC
ncbi:hypothetical protein DU506_14770 [Vreelandella rituensis]|uniref:Uncharacterized protein n=1 Tax=Vreelandella rituensis TaxID=2282306 RepID=A0A368TX61_9GAMM|nr:hypothetical protein DU506_14770 [Halomonas rituensis]